MRKASSSLRGLAVVSALAALLTSAAGCGDTDERPATWSYISATIIQPNCGTSRCHSEGANVEDLKLDTIQGGYQSLINCCVVAGDDTSGSLISRLNGNAAGVDIQRMPVDEPLPQADIDLIAKWIREGAMNN
jgi:hypothetical protein